MTSFRGSFWFATNSRAWVLTLFLENNFPYIFVSPFLVGLSVCHVFDASFHLLQKNFMNVVPSFTLQVPRIEMYVWWTNAGHSCSPPRVGRRTRPFPAWTCSAAIPEVTITWQVSMAKGVANQSWSNTWQCWVRDGEPGAAHLALGAHEGQVESYRRSWLETCNMNWWTTTRLYGLGKSYPRIACRRSLKSLQGH